MIVTITPAPGYGAAVELVARDFDSMGSSPDHFELIAPAYLAPLTAGAPYVTVTYRTAEGWHTERHTAIGRRDGRVVGTAVEIIGWHDDTEGNE